MATKTQRQMIEETYKTMIVLSTVLLGADDKPGLVDKVETLNNRHRKLSRNFWILVSFLTGSGALAGGIVGLLN